MATSYPIDENSFGYTPSLQAGVAFTVVYGVFTLISLYATVRRKLWFLSFLLGALMETLGWIGRLGASQSPCNDSWFIMQICCLIIAPAFFSSTLYILLGILLQQAPSTKVLSPKLYIVIFCTLDFFSLLLQAVGGGLASSGVTEHEVQIGTNIIIAGVFVQIAGMAAFTVTATVHVSRAASAHLGLSKRVLAIMVSSTIFITARNVYRAVELLGGWNGRINTTESYLIVLDGVMMVLTLFALSLLIVIDVMDPCLLRRGTREVEDDSAFEKGSGRSSSTGMESQTSV